MPDKRMIPRKQSATHEHFLAALANIVEIVPRRTYEAEKRRAARVVTEACGGRRSAFGWSGGKDSIALQAVCEIAGVADCVFGMTRGLEYPGWLAWVTRHMPDRLTVVSNDWDLNWLAENQHMLFPDSSTASRWFKGVQHFAQESYCRANGIELLILGRRLGDGNQILNRSGFGVTLCNPIADWSHELTLAALQYDWLDKGLAMPPFYTWPRGFRCGTHAWPARQWCGTVENGWREIMAIDRTIVELAAAYNIRGAAEAIERAG